MSEREIRKTSADIFLGGAVFEFVSNLDNFLDCCFHQKILEKLVDE